MLKRLIARARFPRCNEFDLEHGIIYHLSDLRLSKSSTEVTLCVGNNKRLFKTIINLLIDQVINRSIEITQTSVKIMKKFCKV